MKSIICFGEVLWDLLPAGKKLGGAPLNVSLRVQSLGSQSSMISSVGNDSLGNELSKAIKAHGGRLDHIQVCEEFDTSEVWVTLDEHGTASYDIRMPCAWDAITLRERDLEAVKRSDAFIYGSLVARQRSSRATLIKLLDHARYKVFDVNLRPPHYTLERIVDLMKAADFVKLNDEEMYELCLYLGFEDKDMQACIRFLAQRTDTDEICVTRGKDGAMLYYDHAFYCNEGYPVKVADTVGAGDSFLASIITKLLEGAPPQGAIDFACAVGSIVASKSGANPPVNASEINQMIKSRS